MRALFALALLLAVTACGPVTPELRNKAASLAAGRQMQSVEIPAGEFTLQAYERITDPAAPVRIYIEGDGNAWLARSQISSDPTPLAPVALQLSVRDTAPNVAYLARPCQYVMTDVCGPRIWTASQFSERVIGSIDKAIDRWKGHAIELVGYSGGGAVAVLIAERRSDVVSIRTVAGNIDTDMFVRVHNITPFSDSLNPVSSSARIALIPQRHFVGANDTVVPETIAQSYQSHLLQPNCSAVEVVEGRDHFSGWPELWDILLGEKLPCRP